MEALILVAESNRPAMLARIGVMRAINRRIKREFHPERKDHHWEIGSWRGIDSQCRSVSRPERAPREKKSSAYWPRITITAITARGVSTAIVARVKSRTSCRVCWSMIVQRGQREIDPAPVLFCSGTPRPRGALLFGAGHGSMAGLDPHACLHSRDAAGSPHRRHGLCMATVAYSRRRFLPKTWPGAACRAFFSRRDDGTTEVGSIAPQARHWCQSVSVVGHRHRDPDERPRH